MKVLCLVATFVGCVLVSGGLPIPGFSGLSTVTDVTTAASDTAIIGGADGPTAIFLGCGTDSAERDIPAPSQDRL